MLGTEQKNAGQYTEKVIQPLTPEQCIERLMRRVRERIAALEGVNLVEYHYYAWESPIAEQSSVTTYAWKSSRTRFPEREAPRPQFWLTSKTYVERPEALRSPDESQRGICLPF